MPMYIKMDIFQVTERKNEAVYRTKKVGYHWFQMGSAPEINERLKPELVKQNGLPEGEYFYVSTLDSINDLRIPRGGLYK